MLSEAFRSGLQALKEEVQDILNLLQVQVDAIHAAVESVAESVAKAKRREPSDWSEWSIVDCEEFQELRNRFGARGRLGA